MYCMPRVLAMLPVSLADAAGGAGKLSSQPEGMPQSWCRANGTGNRATSRIDGADIEGGATTGGRAGRPRKQGLRAAAPTLRRTCCGKRRRGRHGRGSSGFRWPWPVPSRRGVQVSTIPSLSVTPLKTASCLSTVQGRLGPGVSRVRNPAAALRARPGKNGTRSRSS